MRFGCFRLLLLFAFGFGWFPCAGYAKDSVPDWVRAAAAQSLPAGPLLKDAVAVVLLDDTVLTVATNGQAVEHRRRVVRILRPTGRDEGRVRLSFDADDKILSLHVWSIGPDGHEYAMKDSEIGELGYPGAGSFYEDMRMRVASPPGCDPGGVVAYEYEQRSRPYTHEAHWFFQENIPHLAQSYTLELPANYLQVTSWAHHDPVKAIDLEHQRTRWELATTPQIDLSRVPMAPAASALEGRMTVHYAAANEPAVAPLGTWGEVGASYDRLARSRMVPTPEIAAKAAELTAGSSDFYDRTRAIAEFVQKDIRYFVIEQGIGGIQPHAAGEIFRNRYGDCKDKSTLLSAMLASVGIHSTLVLVDSHRGFVDPANPSSLGNHAIAAVEIPAGYNSPRLHSVVMLKSGRRYLLVDPTWDKTNFGQIEHNLQGGFAILIEPTSSELVEIPVLDPELNTLRRSGTLTLSADGALMGSVMERRFGDLSELTRAVDASATERERQLRLEHLLSPDFSAFTADQVKVTDANALGKDVVTTFALVAPRYGRKTGPLLMLRPRVFGRSAPHLDQEPRLVPINLGQTSVRSDDFKIDLPEGYTADELPDPVDLDLGFAAYRSNSRLEGNVLHYTRTYTVRQVVLPADRYADLQHLAGVIANDEQSNAVLKKK